MKVLKSRKRIGSLVPIIIVSLTLSGCVDKSIYRNSIDHRLETLGDSTKTEKTTALLDDDNTTVIINSEKIPYIKDYSGDDLIEALKSVEYKTDFESLELLASRMYIKDYKGTAEEKALMLKILKEYAETIDNTKDYEVNSASATSNWQLYDEDREVRLDNNGKVEFRDHSYSLFVHVLGTEYDERVCGTCGHKQHRVTQKYR